jgi:hypothetical protein
MALRFAVAGLFLVFAGIAGVFLYAVIGGPERLATGGVVIAEDRVGPWQVRAELGDERALLLELAPATEAAADPRQPPPTIRLDMPGHDMALEPLRPAARMEGFVASVRLPMAGEWRVRVEGVEDTLRLQVP